MWFFYLTVTSGLHKKKLGVKANSEILGPLRARTSALEIVASWYSYGPLPVLCTYNPIYKMYNPTYNQL